MAERTYRFREVERCDMCGSSDFRLLGMRLNRSQGLAPRSAAGVAVAVKRCCDCGLVFSDPQPIPASISDHYGVPPEEYWQVQNIGIEEPHVAVAIANAKRLIGFRDGMTALDVGAGLGESMKALARSGFDAYGIEPSASFHSRLDPERVKLSTIEDADFEPGSFDFILFGAVLEHLYSPSLALKQALRWLKPRGIIYAYVPSSRWLIAKLLNRFFALRGTNYVTHLSPMHVPYHLFEFTAESFRRNGELLGYEVALSSNDVCAIPYVPRPLQPVARKYMERTQTGMMLAVYLRCTGRRA